MTANVRGDEGAKAAVLVTHNAKTVTKSLFMVMVIDLMVESTMAVAVEIVDVLVSSDLWASTYLLTRG